jgi:hypothetical protein
MEIRDSHIASDKGCVPRVFGFGGCSPKARMVVVESENKSPARRLRTRRIISPKYIAAENRANRIRVVLTTVVMILCLVLAGIAFLPPLLGVQSDAGACAELTARRCE